MVALQQTDIISNIRYVAVYLRKSRGTGDMEVDLEKHTKKIKEYCKQYNWSYVIYEEIASGSDIENRPQMQRLLKDVNEGMYDAVFAFDVDRLSRGGSSDQERIFSTLRNTDTLLVVANPFKIYNLNDETDDMMIDVFGFVGKMEYKQIRKRMMAGKKIGLRMGRWTSGIPPYGYRYNNKDKKLEVHEEEGKVVREIVEKYLNGYSTTDIAWDLNRKRIPSPRGSSWKSVTITRIFKSQVYQGHIVGNKSEGNRNKNRSKTSKPFRYLPEDEWVIVRNCHKALISEDEYEKIMSLLNSKSKKRYKNKINTFTGLIKCGVCGKNMHHKKFDDKDGVAACECGNHGGETHLIEVSIYEAAIQLRNTLNQIKIEDVQSQKEQQLLKQIEDVEKELDKQDLAIERIEEAFEAGLYDVAKTKKKIKEREEERWKLEKELQNLKKQLTSVDTHDNKERISKIDEFIEDIKKDNNPEKKNQIYKTLISEIIWNKESTRKVDITINFL